MTQTHAYPLNERQLKLVFNLPNYAALYMFKEPLTLSEAARRLQVPTNVMHYRVKRLLEAGLLEVADDSNRSRTYKTVAQTFSIAPEVLPAVTDALPSMLDGMLSKLHRNFLGRVVAELGTIEALIENGPIIFELDESLILGSVDLHKYPTWVSISTPSLSAAQFQKVVSAVRTVLDEVKVDKGERCAVAFLAFQGEGAM